jgi:hypothetical protein
MASCLVLGTGVFLCQDLPDAGRDGCPHFWLNVLLAKPMHRFEQYQAPGRESREVFRDVIAPTRGMSVISKNIEILSGNKIHTNTQKNLPLDFLCV